MSGRHRNSPMRASILDFLKNFVNPPTTGKLHTAARPHHSSASFASLYRNLNMDLSFTESLEFSRGELGRFDARTLSHARLHCDESGRFHELPPAPAYLFRNLSTDYSRCASRLSFHKLRAECKT